MQGKTDEAKIQSEILRLNSHSAAVKAQRQLTFASFGVPTPTAAKKAEKPSKSPDWPKYDKPSTSLPKTELKKQFFGTHAESL